ncbi:MAG TPA: 50S ribosomal protein L34 [Candidatus Azosocius sp. HAIN]
MSLTFNPSILRLRRRSGFRVRMRTANGRALLQRRRFKGRKILSR